MVSIVDRQYTDGVDRYELLDQREWNAVWRSLKADIRQYDETCLLGKKGLTACRCHNGTVAVIGYMNDGELFSNVVELINDNVIRKDE